MATTPKIELRGVKKRFGPKVVLDGIDLTIDAGTSLVIIGGSGTGKSVTIKCILGILTPDEGKIFVDGVDTTYARGRARDAMLKKFGMLFQAAALFDSIPVWENVAFGLIQGRGMGRKQARDIAIEKLAKVGLGQTSPSCRRPSFPAACRSAWALRAPSLQTLRSSSSTSRRRASIPSWPT